MYLLVTKQGLDILNILFLMPKGGAGPYYGYGPFFITWTIIYELCFYLLFAVSMRIWKSRRVELTIVVVLFNTIILQYLLTGGISLIPNDTPEVNFSIILSFLINPINLLFVIGLAFFYLFESIKKVCVIYSHASLSLFLMLLLLLGVFIMYTQSSGHGVMQLGLGATILFCCFLILHFIKISSIETENFTLLEVLLIFLGRVSYSLYLCHYIAIELRGWYFQFLPGLEVHFHFVVVMIAVFLVTYVFYRFVDMPMNNIGIKLASKF